MGLLGFLNKNSKDKIDVFAAVDKSATVVQTVSEAYLDLRSLKEVRSFSMKNIHSVSDFFGETVPVLDAVYDELKTKDSGLYKLDSLISKNETIQQIKESGIHKQALKLASGKTVVAINPVTLVIMATVVSMEQEVKVIKSYCDEILAFLQHNKEAQIEGDITTLNHVIDDYKFNWDNQEYCQNHHKLILDIKRNAEQNIIFYQKQLATSLAGNKTAIASKTTQEKQKEIENLFKYYQLSLYIYAYSSFLEVVLLGNFEKRYLDSIIKRIEELNNDYQTHYNEALEVVKEIANNSIEAKARKGVGDVLQKITKFEFITKAGKNLEESSKKQSADSFLCFENNPNVVFKDKIEQLVFITDPNTEVYFDKNDIVFAKQ